MNTRWWTVMICGTALHAAAQEPAPKAPVDLAKLPVPNLKVKFHQDFRGGDPNNPNLRFMGNTHIQYEPGGVRINMPAGQGFIRSNGIAPKFHVKGDFQVTASYEVLKAEQPTEGYGVGVSLFVAVDPDAGNAVSLSRRTGSKGTINFVANRMKPNPATKKTDHRTRSKTSTATTGKLRIQRVGAMTRFLVADGEHADFVPIVQDSKSQIEVEFTPDDIRFVQFGGDAGRSQAALDVRLLDLTIEAEDLPGLIEAAQPLPGVPIQNANRPRSNVAFIVVGILAGSLIILAALGAAAWHFLRRPAPAQKPARTTTAAKAPRGSSTRGYLPVR